MKTSRKEMMINADVYLIFQNLLDDLMESSTPEIKNVLQELKHWSLNSEQIMESIIPQIQKIESHKKAEPLVIGVMYYFLAKIFAKRKDFALSLNLLEKSESHLTRQNSDLAQMLNKEIYMIKMAYHYSDN
jgi:hypothetical protein